MLKKAIDKIKILYYNNIIKNNDVIKRNAMSRKEQKDRSETVRNLIIQTTIDIIKENGFEAVSIRNIGKKMGYSSGVIYYHFKNKQEIIDAVHDMANKDIIHIIQNNSFEDKGTIENINSVFYEVMKIAIKDKDIFELIMIEKYTVRKESINPWISMIEEELMRGVEKKEVRNINVKQVAFCIWSAYLGFFYMIEKENEVNLASAEDSFNTMKQLIAKGIGVDK